MVFWWKMFLPLDSRLSVLHKYIRSTWLQISSTVTSLRVCGTVFTVHRTVKVLSSENENFLKYWNTAAMYCKCNVCVDERADSFPRGQSMHKNMLNYNALYFISNKLPLTSSPSFFSSYLSLYPITRINLAKHIISCAPVHIILRFWPVSSVLLLTVMFTHG